jgi:hypothetical protein
VRTAKHPGMRGGLIAALLLCLWPTLVHARCSGSETYHFTASTPAAVVASTVNGAPSGASFCFDGGVKWRMESILRPSNDQTFIANGPDAILDGSVLLPNTIGSGAWSAGSGYYSITAANAGVTLQSTLDSGITCFPVNPGCAYRQDLYLNGIPLVHVLPSSFSPRPPLTAGQWATDYMSNVIYMHDNPAGQTVEMSSTAQAISSSATGVTVNGITAQKYADPAFSGVIATGSLWTVEYSEVRFNHGEGIVTQNGGLANNNLIQNNFVHDNGIEGIGLGGGNSSGNQVIGNTISNNGFIGTNQPGEYGGIKASAQSSRVVIRENTITNNDGVGIWTDVGSSGVTISLNTVSLSSHEGIRIESSGVNGSVQVTSNTLHSNVQSRVAATGLMFSNTGSCSGNNGEISLIDSANTAVVGNSITTQCGGIGLFADQWGYFHNNLVQGNSLTYCGVSALSPANNSLIGGSDAVPGWQANTAHRLPSTVYPNAVTEIIDGNGNTVTLSANFPSGSSAPNWCTAIGCTTSDNSGTWTLRNLGRPVFNAGNSFRNNKYFFASAAQLTNHNWTWSTTDQPGINPISWATWQADGQDVGGSAAAPAGTCTPGASAQPRPYSSKLRPAP